MTIVAGGEDNGLAGGELQQAAVLGVGICAHDALFGLYKLCCGSAEEILCAMSDGLVVMELTGAVPVIKLDACAVLGENLAGAVVLGGIGPILQVLAEFQGILAENTQ